VCGVFRDLRVIQADPLDLLDRLDLWDRQDLWDPQDLWDLLDRKELQGW
jgi:hypothetical protein